MADSLEDNSVNRSETLITDDKVLLGSFNCILAMCHHEQTKPAFEHFVIEGAIDPYSVFSSDALVQ